MKKIFALFAALTVIAGAAMAGSGGGFDWTGTGAAYDATQKALILENANLTSLKIATWSTDMTNFGTTFTIIVRGNNNKINPTSKIDGMTIGGSAYGQYDDIILNINGESADAKLEVSGQLNSAIYFNRGGYLRLNNVDLTCNGRLQTAKYGISAADGYYYYIWAYPAVTLTLDGKTSQLKNAFSFTAKNTSYAITYPAGATMNPESGNLFFILDGDNYNGKTTIKTGSGIKIGGVELDYTNWDNFTQNVSAGSVSYAAGVMSLNDAQIDADMEISSAAAIQSNGMCVINGNMQFKRGGVKFLSSQANDTLIINGDITTMGGAFNIENTHVYAYSPNEAFTITMEGQRVEMTLGGEYNGSLYAESKFVGVGVANMTAPDNYTINEYTSGNKQYLHARYVESYGIAIYTQSARLAVTSENCNDPLGDGTVKYVPEQKMLVLENARLTYLVKNGSFAQFNIRLLGTNRIECERAQGILSEAPVLIDGGGTLNIVSLQGNNGIRLMNQDNPSVRIQDAKVNINTLGYSFVGDNNVSGMSVIVERATLTMQSGKPGLLSNVGSFELIESEFVAPEDASFFNGQICANYQPVEANRMVEIKPVEEEGIENVVLTEKAQKVFIDGQVYIIRDNKMFDLTGTQVR